MGSDQLKRAVRSSVDIDYKLAMVPDIFLPLVFVYQPILKRLTITNQSHFSNPQQFLDANLCRTTSGFLNFIGALCIRVDSENGVIEWNVESAMNQGLDQWFRWLYYCLDTGNGFDPKLLYVSADNPERYLYDYTGKEGGARSG